VAVVLAVPIPAVVAGLVVPTEAAGPAGVAAGPIAGVAESAAAVVAANPRTADRVAVATCRAPSFLVPLPGQSAEQPGKLPQVPRRASVGGVLLHRSGI
jgi:hypothetical protein